MFKVYGPSNLRTNWILALLEELGQPYLYLPSASADGALLDTGGERFNDPVAACLYLADTQPHTQLAPPPHSPERAEYDQWMRLATQPFEAQLEAARANPAALQALSARFQPIAAQISYILGARPYLVSEHFTSADLLIATSLAWLIAQGRLTPPPPLAAWISRVTGRPSVQRAPHSLSLSVLILCAPGQESQLPLCLEMLTRQSFRNFEVLILDGTQSPQAQASCAAFADQLDLHHLPRPRETNAARFNAGRDAALCPWLVCLNAATLLNPEALKSYAAYLLTPTPGPRLVFGYLGTSVERTEATPDHPYAPSQWFPDQQVAYLDYRIQLYRRQGLQPTPDLSKHPYWYATGSNFACSRSPNAPDEIILADPTIGDWRLACVDLAYRAQQQGASIDFLLDAWAEQLLEAAPAAPRRYPLLQADPPARLLSSEAGSQALLSRLFDHYLPGDPRYEASGRALLAQPEARIALELDHYTLTGRYKLTSKPAGARPDFLLIGAHRAGTNALHYALARHRELNPPIMTEIHYFNLDINYARGRDWYLHHFEFTPGRLSYDSSAGYLPSPDAPARIAAFHADIKLIAVLREPVARAFSDWNLCHGLSPSNPAYDPRSFEAALAAPDNIYLERGRYAEQLARYSECFAPEQLLLLDYAEFVAEPAKTLAKCCAFLGIAPLELAQMPRFPGKYGTPLHEATRDWLRAYYAPHNQRLKQAFGLDFAWLD